MTGMKYIIRCWTASPLFGEIAICQSIVPAMMMGRRLTGNPMTWVMVSGWERSWIQRK